MKRAASALVLALVAPLSWAATTIPSGVNTTYTNAAGITTSAEVLLRSETTAGAVVTRKTVGTAISSLANMAKGAVTRQNAVGLAITGAVAAIGWYVDEATRQVMEPQKVDILPNTGSSIAVTNGCSRIPLNTVVSDGNYYWSVAPWQSLSAPWGSVNNCNSLPSINGSPPQLYRMPKSAGLPPAPQPKVIPWDQVVSTPGIPTSSLPQSSVQDQAWPQEWPELSTTVTNVNNTVTNYYEGSKDNYDQNTINSTAPADEAQMPTLAPWQPAIKPLTDLGTDIPKTTAPIANGPTLPIFQGQGLCRGFDVNIPPILVGTLDRHCYYIDTYVRPMLMWLFFMWTAYTIYMTWQREAFRGIA
ncbi:hypothetical protein D3C76_511010 [compost metagenome]